MVVLCSVRFSVLSGHDSDEASIGDQPTEWGPDGSFYPLTQRCFEYKVSVAGWKQVAGDVWCECGSLSLSFFFFFSLSLPVCVCVCVCVCESVYLSKYIRNKKKQTSEIDKKKK